MSVLTSMPPLSTGLELILNAAEGALQIVVTDNEEPQVFEEWRKPQRASEILADAIQEICRRLEIKPRSFRRIACVVGPGSFTGIRLVLATAAAMRRASKAKLASLDYLQALATTAVMRRGALYGTKICVLTHARRNLVHFQAFISYGPQIPALASAEVELITPQEALRRLGASPCLACGSALRRNPELFNMPVTGKGPEEAPEAILMPDLTSPGMEALCLLARHGDYFPTDLEPKYVRSCDAMDHLDEKNLEKAQKLMTEAPKSEI